MSNKGIVGLETRPGRGRKPILVKDDLPMVKQASQQERQRLSLAKKNIKDSTDKPNQC